MAGGADTPGQGGLEQRPSGLGIPPATGTVGGLDIERDLLRPDEPSSSPAGDESA
jgi:hypothetical protein